MDARSGTRTGTAWSALWRTDDWLSVWTGFLILGVFIAGFSLRLPDWRWTTGAEFGRKTAGWTSKVQSLGNEAESGGAASLKEQSSLLAMALGAGDRRSILDAATSLQKVAKDAPAGDVKAKAEKLSGEIRGAAGLTVGRVFTWGNLKGCVAILIAFWIIGTLLSALLGEKFLGFLAGFPILFILTALSSFIAGNETVAYYGIEQVFWALFLGLFISNVLGVPGWLKAAAKTELYIKTGLVLLGAEVLIGTILRTGALGMIQAVLVIAPVWYVCYWLAKKIGLDREFGAILATGVSVCGVSAAIAAGGALKGDPKKVSHAVSLILLMAIPMLILEPIVARAVRMPLRVAGAWIGGTIDTTAAVVAAGSIAGDKAREVAVVVKFAQNALIGLIAFLLAVWSAVWKKGSPKGSPDERPRVSEIWVRFPKFVLGFIAASLVFSLLLTEGTATSITRITKDLRGIWFSLAFLSIGIETRFKDLFAMGRGKPALAFVGAQLFNIVWTLALAYILYSGGIFPAPAI
jgi:uncharacterized integral membrane protein (TIGR00698 family)